MNYKDLFHIALKLISSPAAAWEEIRLEEDKQKVFMAFAGIGDMTYKGKPITSGNTGLMDDTGIVYYLLQHNIIKNLFTSILLLAIFLMIIFTVMAFIKNVYAAKPKGWKDIIGNTVLSKKKRRENPAPGIATAPSLRYTESRRIFPRRIVYPCLPPIWIARPCRHC